jgi:predicted ATP-grasp superfamily ATP-dependent carboligase
VGFDGCGIGNAGKVPAKRGSFMVREKLHIFKRHDAGSTRLVIGLSGWMNNGDVSVGSVEWLIDELGAVKTAAIAPDGFYLYNVPGSMEIAEEFRPFARIEEGILTAYDEPENIFHYDKENHLMLFLGKEPNVNWDEFAECIVAVCKDYSIREIYVVGSVGGLIPHTREGKIVCSLSDVQYRDDFAEHGFKFTNYEGPASFVTHLLMRCVKNDIMLAHLVLTVPAYIHGDNPKCMEAAIRNLKNILGLKIKLNKLRNLSDEFERKLNDVIRDMPELVASIEKLEEDFDKELINEEMGDLKDWLKEKGVRLD